MLERVGADRPTLAARRCRFSSHDGVAGTAVDHIVDLGQVVPRMDDEACGVTANGVIDAERQPHSRDARPQRALAAKERAACVGQLSPAFDDRLVRSRPARSMRAVR
jgi:hypothetical protein